MNSSPITDYDAIIIGAGHNGLVSAAYLSRHGYRTMLIEARPQVGGTASSEIFAGAVANICNCDHLTFRTTPIMDELQLASHGLTYIDVEPPQVNGDWDTGKLWAMYKDVDATLDSLSKAHPDQVDGYRRYVRDTIPVARLILEAGSQPPSRIGLASKVLRRGGRGMTHLLKFSRMSAADVLRQYFTSDAVMGPALVEGPMVWGISPETPGSGLGALTYALRHVANVGRPVGGSGALTDALKNAYLAAGGHLRLNTKAISINCEGDHARSVTMSDGSTLTAPIIISASDPARTFVQWLKNPPSRAQSLVHRWRHAEHAQGYESKIDAVVSSAPVFRGAPTINGQPVVGPTHVISPTLAEIHMGAQDMARGIVTDRVGLLFNVPSGLDPTVAPAGKHVVSLEALFTPYNARNGWTSPDEPLRWMKLLDPFLETPLTEIVEEWRVKTPAEYESEFHLPRGHATSFPGGPLAAFSGRPQELTRYRTAVKGLYLTGAATFPGAGVWGASGRNAALAVIRENG
jgi:phytoene dehydrogenase-like protein